MKVRYSFLIACTLLVLVSCTKKEAKNVLGSDGETIDTASVSIAVMPTMDCMPLYLAKENGWFDKSGIKVSLSPFTAQMDVDTALLGGSVKGAVTDVFRAEVMNKRRKLTYVTSTEAKWSLITNRAARLNKLEQFGDKMVAMTRYSATDYLTDATFHDVTTTAPYFKVQINDVDVRLNMMLANELDAAWMPEPQATIAELNGHKRLKTKNKDKYGVVVFRSEFLKKNKSADFVDVFKRVYSESCDSINKYGLENYASVLNKYYHIDTVIIKSMPHIVFTHAESPTPEIVELARKKTNDK